MSKDTDAVAKLIAESIAQINKNNVEGWVATLADEITYLPPDHPTVVGKKAVETWARRDYFDKFKTSMKFTLDRVEVTGPVAIAWGQMTMGLTPKQGGSEIVLVGKFFDVLKRGTFGKRKLTHVAFSSNAPIK